MSALGSVNNSYEKWNTELENPWMPAAAKEKIKSRLVTDPPQTFYVDVSEAIQRFPKDPQLYLFRAQTLTILGQPTQAIDDLNFALKLSPKQEILEQIYMALGVCYRSLEDNDRVVEYYAKAASLGNPFAVGVLSTMTDINPSKPTYPLGKKSVSSVDPFDYNIPSTLQETFEATREIPSKQPVFPGVSEDR